MAKRTTQDLRNLLFDTIDNVISGSMEIEDAKAVAVLAKVIVDSARLEVNYAEAQAKLDASGTNINIGPILISDDTVSGKAAKQLTEGKK